METKLQKRRDSNFIYIWSFEKFQHYKLFQHSIINPNLNIHP